MRAAVSAVAVAVLAGIAGCGHQDRLDIASPGQPTGLTVVEWGEFEDLLAPAFTSSVATSQGAWSTDEGLIAGSDGIIVHRDGDRFRRLDLPGDEDAVGLVCRPDGGAWSLDRDGRVYELVGGGWTLDRDLVDASYRGMQVDAQGRVWAYGWGGKLWRRHETGAWQRFVVPDSLHFDDAWIAPDGTGHLITEDLIHVTVDGDAWSQETIEEIGYIYPDKYIEGTADGRLVAGSSGNDHLWVHDGAEWLSLDTGEPAEDAYGNNRFQDAFWLDGELYALVLRYSHHFDADLLVERRDGDAWVDPQPVPSRDSGSGVRSFPLGTGRMLRCQQGMTAYFEPGSVTVEMPELGRIAGAVWWDGAFRAGYESGEYMTAVGDEWVLEDRPLPADEWLSEGLEVAPDGALVFFGGHEARRLLPGGQPEPIEGYTGGDVYPQSDGSILVRSGGEIREYVDGALISLRELEEMYRPYWICRTAADTFWMFRYRLITRLTEAGEDLPLLTTDWEPQGMLKDPDRGLVVYGTDRVMVREDGALVDRSPYTKERDEWRRRGFRSLCLDGQGGWIGFNRETEAILRYDGQEWQQMNYFFPDKGDVYDISAVLQPAGEGRFIFRNGQMVCVIRAEGAAP